MILFCDPMGRQLRHVILSALFHRQDSIVNEEINYDLLKTIDGVQSGTVPCPELIGPSLVSKTQETIPTAMQKVYCKDSTKC